MKKLIILFVLIYLNVPDRYCMLPNNILEANTFGVPSPYEFLWITTMSYCNVHYLTYNKFIGVGVPIQNQTYSNDDIAAFLLPDNMDDWSDETVFDSPYTFLKLREASQIIESFVFETKEYQHVTGAEDITTGLSIWESIEDQMITFMNNIYILSNQVNQVISDLNIQRQNGSTVDPSAMMYLYQDIFDQMVDMMSENIVPFKNAFNFLEKLNLKKYKQKNIKQEKKNENNLDSREYTQVKLTKVYELYIEALTIFYNSKSIDTHFSELHFIMWYDLNSSKGVFDYTASILLTHIIKLREYIQETFKYNTTNIPELTLKVQEYVSTNLYDIIGIIKSPLQKILNDENLIKDDVLLNPKYYDKISIDGLIGSENEDLHKERIKNIQLFWNDSSIQIVASDIINKYNTSLCDTNINHNTRLMYWVEQMSNDEQNRNVLQSSIYAMIILNNFENVVLCSYVQNKSETDKAEIIRNLMDDVDQKLKIIYKYSIYSIKDNRENIISDVWNYIKNQKNNIFNVIDWLNKSVSKTYIPYWPNDVECDEIYINNTLQLASVSSDMLYDVTLTSMHRALENNEIDSEKEESNALFILEDLERTKHTYKNVIKQIKNLITINVRYIKSNKLLGRTLKKKAIKELANCMKYKIFALTELIIPAFRKTEYYNLEEPEYKQDYNEHFIDMNNAFYHYFGIKTDLKNKNKNALQLIESSENKIIFIYNKLRYKNKRIKKKHRYIKVLKYNMVSVKRMYRSILNQLKKITKVNNKLNLKNNQQEIKRRLVIAVSIIMEDFIRFDNYMENQNKTTPLFNGRKKYTISAIDIESTNDNIDYVTIYNSIQKKQSKNINEKNSKTLNTKPLNTFAVYTDNSNSPNIENENILSSRLIKSRSTDQESGDNDNSSVMSETNIDFNKNEIKGFEIPQESAGSSEENSQTDLPIESSASPGSSDESTLTDLPIDSSLSSSLLSSFTSTTTTTDQGSNDSGIPSVISETNLGTSHIETKSLDMSQEIPVSPFRNTPTESQYENTIQSRSLTSSKKTTLSTDTGLNKMEYPSLNSEKSEIEIKSLDIAQASPGSSDESSLTDLPIDSSLSSSIFSSFTSRTTTTDQDADDSDIPSVISETNVSSSNIVTKGLDMSQEIPVSPYESTPTDSQYENTIQSRSLTSSKKTTLSTDTGLNKMDYPSLNSERSEIEIKSLDIAQASPGSSDESSLTDLPIDSSLSSSIFSSFTSRTTTTDQDADDSDIPSVISETNVSSSNIVTKGLDMSQEIPVSPFRNTPTESQLENTIQSRSLTSSKKTTLSTDTGLNKMEYPSLNSEKSEIEIKSLDITQASPGSSDESIPTDLPIDSSLSSSIFSSFTSTTKTTDQDSDDSDIPSVISETNVSSSNIVTKGLDMSQEIPVSPYESTPTDSQYENTIQSRSLTSSKKTTLSTDTGLNKMNYPSINSKKSEIDIKGLDITQASPGSSDESIPTDLPIDSSLSSSIFSSFTSTTTTTDLGSDDSDIPSVISETNVGTSNIATNGLDISQEIPVSPFRNTPTDSQLENTIQSRSLTSSKKTTLSTDTELNKMDYPSLNSEKSEIDIKGLDIPQASPGSSDESTLTDLPIDSSLSSSIFSSFTSTTTNTDQGSDDSEIPSVISETNVSSSNIVTKGLDMSQEIPVSPFRNTPTDSQLENTIQSRSLTSSKKTTLSTDTGLNKMEYPSLNSEKSEIDIKGLDITQASPGSSDENITTDLPIDSSLSSSIFSSFTSTTTTTDQDSDDSDNPSVISETNVSSSNIVTKGLDMPQEIPVSPFRNTPTDSQLENTIQSRSLTSSKKTTLSTDTGLNKMDYPSLNSERSEIEIKSLDIAQASPGSSDESSLTDLPIDSSLSSSIFSSFTSRTTTTDLGSDDSDIPSVISETNVGTSNIATNGLDISQEIPVSPFRNTPTDSQLENTIQSRSLTSSKKTTLSTDTGLNKMDYPSLNSEKSEIDIKGLDIPQASPGSSDESTLTDLPIDSSLSSSIFSSFTSTTTTTDQDSDDSDIPSVISETNVSSSNIVTKGLDMSQEIPVSPFRNTPTDSQLENTIQSRSLTSSKKTTLSTDTGLNKMEYPSLNSEKSEIDIKGLDITQASPGSSDENITTDLPIDSSLSSSIFSSFTSTTTTTDQDSDDSDNPSVISETNVSSSNIVTKGLDMSQEIPVSPFRNTPTDSQLENTIQSRSLTSSKKTTLSTDTGLNKMDYPSLNSERSDIEIKSLDIAQASPGSSDESSLTDLPIDSSLSSSIFSSFTSRTTTTDQDADDSDIPSVISETNVSSSNIVTKGLDMSQEIPVSPYESTPTDSQYENTIQSRSLTSSKKTTLSTDTGLNKMDYLSLNSEKSEIEIKGLDIAQASPGSSDESIPTDLPIDSSLSSSIFSSFTSRTTTTDQDADDRDIPSVISETNVSSSNIVTKGLDMSQEIPVSPFRNTPTDSQLENTIQSRSLTSSKKTTLSTDTGLNKMDTPSLNSEKSEIDIKGLDIPQASPGSSDESTLTDLPIDSSLSSSIFSSFTSTTTTTDQDSDDSDIPSVISETNVSSSNIVTKGLDMSQEIPVSPFRNTPTDSQLENTIQSRSLTSSKKTTLSTDTGLNKMEYPSLNSEKSEIEIKSLDITQASPGSSDESIPTDLPIDSSLSSSIFSSFTSTTTTTDQDSDDSDIPSVISETNVSSSNIVTKGLDMSQEIPVSPFRNTPTDSQLENTIQSRSLTSSKKTTLSTDTGLNKMEYPSLNSEKSEIDIKGLDITQASPGSSDENITTDLPIDSSLSSSIFSSFTSTTTTTDQDSDDSDNPSVISETNVSSSNIVTKGLDMSQEIPVSPFRNTPTDSQLENTIQSRSLTSSKKTTLSTDTGLNKMDYPSLNSERSDIEIKSLDIAQASPGSSDESSLTDLPIDSSLSSSIFSSFTSRTTTTDQDADDSDIPSVISETNVSSSNIVTKGLDMSQEIPVSPYESTPTDSQYENTIQSRSLTSSKKTTLSTDTGLNKMDYLSLNSEKSEIEIKGLDIAQASPGSSDESIPTDLPIDSSLSSSIFSSFTSRTTTTDQDADDRDIPSVISETNVSSSNIVTKGLDMSQEIPVSPFRNTPTDSQLENTIQSRSLTSSKKTTLSTDTGLNKMDTPSLNSEKSEIDIKGLDIPQASPGSSDESTLTDLPIDSSLSSSIFSSFTSTTTTTDQDSDDSDIPSVISETNVSSSNIVTKGLDMSQEIPVSPYESTPTDSQYENTIQSRSLTSSKKTTLSTDTGLNKMNYPSINSKKSEIDIKGLDITQASPGSSDENIPTDLPIDSSLSSSIFSSFTSTTTTTDLGSDDSDIPSVISETNVGTSNIATNGLDISQEIPVSPFRNTPTDSQLENTIQSRSLTSSKKTTLSTDTGLNKMEYPSLNSEKSEIEIKSLDITQASPGSSDESIPTDLPIDSSLSSSIFSSFTSTTTTTDQDSDDSDIPSVISETNVSSSNIVTKGLDMSQEIPVSPYESTPTDSQYENTIQSRSLTSSKKTTLSTDTGLNKMNYPSINSKKSEIDIKGLDITQASPGSSDENIPTDLPIDSSLSSSIFSSFTSTTTTTDLGSDDSDIPSVISETNVGTSNIATNGLDISQEIPVSPFRNTPTDSQLENTIQSRSLTSSKKTTLSTDTGLNKMDYPSLNSEKSEIEIKGLDITQASPGSSNESIPTDLPIDSSLSSSIFSSFTSTTTNTDQGSDDSEIPSVISETNVSSSNIVTKGLDMSQEIPVSPFRNTPTDSQLENTIQSRSLTSSKKTTLSTDTGLNKMDYPSLNSEKSEIDIKDLDITQASPGSSDESIPTDLPIDSSLSSSIFSSFTSTTTTTDQDSDDSDIPSVISETNVSSSNIVTKGLDMSQEIPVSPFRNTPTDSQLENTIQSRSLTSSKKTTLSTDTGLNKMDYPSLNSEKSEIEIKGLDITQASPGSSDESSLTDLPIDSSLSSSIFSSFTSTTKTTDQDSDDSDIPSVISETNVSSSNIVTKGLDMSQEIPVSPYESTPTDSQLENTIQSRSLTSSKKTTLSTDTELNKMDYPSLNSEKSEIDIKGLDIPQASPGSSDESTLTDLPIDSSLSSSIFSSFTSTTTTTDQDSDDSDIPSVISETNVSSSNIVTKGLDVSQEIPVSPFRNTPTDSQLENTIQSRSLTSSKKTTLSTDTGLNKMEYPSLNSEKSEIDIKGLDITQASPGSSDENITTDLPIDSSLSSSIFSSFTSTTTTTDQDSDDSDNPSVISETNVSSSNIVTKGLDMPQEIPVSPFRNTPTDSQLENTIQSRSLTSSKKTTLSTDTGLNKMDYPSLNSERSEIEIKSLDIAQASPGSSDESSLTDLPIDSSLSSSIFSSFTSRTTTTDLGSDDSDIPSVISETNVGTSNIATNGLDISQEISVSPFRNTPTDSQLENTIQSRSLTSSKKTTLSTDTGLNKMEYPSLNSEKSEIEIKSLDIAQASPGSSDESSLTDLPIDSSLSSSIFSSFTSRTTTTDQDADDSDIPSVISETNVSSSNIVTKGLDMSQEIPVSPYESTPTDSQYENTIQSRSLTSSKKTILSTDTGLNKMDYPSLNSEKSEIDIKDLDITQASPGSSDESIPTDLPIDSSLSSSIFSSFTSTTTTTDQDSDDSDIPSVISETNVSSSNIVTKGLDMSQEIPVSPFRNTPTDSQLENTIQSRSLTSSKKTTLSTDTGLNKMDYPSLNSERSEIEIKSLDIAQASPGSSDESSLTDLPIDSSLSSSIFSSFTSTTTTTDQDSDDSDIPSVISETNVSSSNIVTKGLDMSQEIPVSPYESTPTDSQYENTIQSRSITSSKKTTLSTDTGLNKMDYPSINSEKSEIDIKDLDITQASPGSSDESIPTDLPIDSSLSSSIFSLFTSTTTTTDLGSDDSDIPSVISETNVGTSNIATNGLDMSQEIPVSPFRNTPTDSQLENTIQSRSLTSSKKTTLSTDTGLNKMDYPSLNSENSDIEIKGLDITQASPGSSDESIPTDLPIDSSLSSSIFSSFTSTTTTTDQDADDSDIPSVISETNVSSSNIVTKGLDMSKEIPVFPYESTPTDSQYENTIQSRSLTSSKKTTLSTDTGLNKMEYPSLNSEKSEIEIKGLDITQATPGSSDESIPTDLPIDSSLSSSIFSSFTSTKTTTDQDTYDSDIPSVISKTNVSSSNIVTKGLDMSQEIPVSPYESTPTDSQYENTIQSRSLTSSKKTTLSTDTVLNKMDNPSLNSEKSEIEIEGFEIAQASQGSLDESIPTDLPMDSPLSSSIFSSFTSTTTTTDQDSDDSDIPSVISETNVSSSNIVIKGLDMSQESPVSPDEIISTDSQYGNSLTSSLFSSFRSSTISSDQGSDESNIPDVIS